MRFVDLLPIALLLSLPACAADPATDPPEVVANYQQSAGALWVDDPFVYWSTSTSDDPHLATVSIMKTPQRGGAVTTYVHDAHGSVRTTRDAVFTLEYGQVRMVPKNGGETKTFDAPANVIWFAADESDLVFAVGDWGSQQIQAISLAGGPIRRIAGSVSSYTFALEDGNVWWAERREAIKRVSVAAGEAVDVTRIQSEPLTMILDAQYVYWVEYSHDLTRAPRSGGPATVISGGSAVGERGLKLRNGRFWWSQPAWHEDHYAPGFIDSIPLNGGDATRAAEGDFQFEDFDVGTEKVFWTEPALDEVLAKRL